MRVRALGLNGHHGASEAIRSRFQTSLRAIDRVWVAGDNFVYLLPECDRSRATGFVKRLADSVGVEVLATIACFPEDGLTGGLLIELVLDDLEPLDMKSPAALNGNGSASPVHRGRAALRRMLGRRRAEPKHAALEWTALAPTPVQNAKKAAK